MASRRQRQGRAGRIPSREIRQTRGPSPPDHALRPLESYLTEGRTFPVLGPQWHTLLGQAWESIRRHARRGVVRVLSGAYRAAAAAAPGPPRGDWVDRVTEAVRGALRVGRDVLDVRAAVGRALSVLDRAILQVHSDLVIGIAREAGVNWYVWTSRRDPLVRVLHGLLDGRVYRWDDPPVSGTGGWRGHPGQPANCRCVPFPLDPNVFGL